MGVLTRIRQARWYLWIMALLAGYGALVLAGQGVVLEASWGAYWEARQIAASRNLTIPEFREWRRDTGMGLDPLFGQILAQTICKDGECAIASLLPVDEQGKARDTLTKFKDSSRLISEGEKMLAAERIDEIHLILRDPKHHTPEELRSWLGRVKDQAYMQAFKP